MTNSEKVGSYVEEYEKPDDSRHIEEYWSTYRRSIDTPDAFWAEQAPKYLSWFRQWDFVLRSDFDTMKFEWFGGGTLNAAFNCIDRHLPHHKDKIAFYWEGNAPGDTKRITYGQLFEKVNQFSAVLKSKGLTKGDGVIIYMPMVVELPVAMLACARIGAIHCVVFSEFSHRVLANRIRDFGPKMVITADGGYKGREVFHLKEYVDEALQQCPHVESVVVFSHIGLKVNLDPHRDVWWHEAVADPELPPFVSPEPMEAEEPLFVLYTSGSIGGQVGIVHTHGGYLLYAAMTTHMVFDLKHDDTFWCTADLGWMTGHSFGVYGPLCNAMTSVLYEGPCCHPDFERYCEIIEKYRVSKFYTTPTVVRTLAKAGEALLKRHDHSSLRLLGLFGEPIRPDCWRWFYQHVGRSQMLIVNTYWQIETGGPILTPLPGVAPIRPGSCSFPFFGIDVALLDDTGEEVEFPNQEGVLCIRKPWPGMARTIYGDHERYVDNYFSQAPGMYFTSDGAKRDEDGYYYVMGRIDEVINVEGYRLGTAEIESTLILHELVLEAAVVGHPHPTKGQGIYAFITLKPGVSKTQDLKRELVTLVRNEVGPIATIDVIQWADALPKTRSGKIVRHILHKIAARDFDNLGDTSAVTNPTVISSLIKERMILLDA